MKINLEPGRYVAAVSGGVDSVVLLDLLSKGGHEVVVAHFDHGIRKDSAEDREFVSELARNYGKRFFYEEGGLGSSASESLARHKRYEFLEKVKKKTGASAIITAHHQDDVLETIIINMLRGTNRKGLSSLKDRPGLLRPLLDYSKSEILDYARQNALRWREDETNKDDRYLRNHVRLNILPKFSDRQKKDLLDISLESAEKNRQIDEMIADLLPDTDEISRRMLVSLSHTVASELIAQWLRNTAASLDKKTIERLVIALKTAEEGKVIEINKNKYFMINKGVIRLKAR